MMVTTQVKYLKISPKKIKTIAQAVVKLSTINALDRLAVDNSKSAKILMKSIQSSVANAANNFKMDKNRLIVKKIEVGKGPFFKRWNPVARGMAHQIKKRTSHLKITLEEIKIPQEKEKKLLPKKKMSAVEKEVNKVEEKGKNGTKD